MQISDTHFGTEQPRVVEALIDFVRRIRPEIVVMSGDITQRARSAQFAAARRFVDRLAAPTIAIPGNHDIPLFNIPARVFHPYANYIRAFGSDLEPQWSTPFLHVVCVNTTRPARRKDGEVSKEQIARVCERLRNATVRQLRVVVTHQPVHVIRARDNENLLHGSETAVHAWSRAGADIIMGGHIHLPYVRSLTDPRQNRRVWVVQAGTAVSRRVRGSIPNSVNVVRHSAQHACRVERWDFDAHLNQFALHSEERLELDAR
ncbi:MAG TPA: metallophosphoesterase [Steroidobacter sp.]|jgi:3',5'-cyclic AMP phosphodiesterase CpdA|nr:metallophosphoesterase [Steroidobacter sp.]